MLKYKKHKFGTINNGETETTDILTGLSGTKRRIVSLWGDIDSDIYFKVYLDADEIVDFECDLITTSKPFIPMDLPIQQGQTVKAGFYNLSAGAVTPTIAIGYEED